MRARSLALALALLAVRALPQAAPENTIRVEIDGLRSAKGEARCSLYATPEGFPTRDENAAAHAHSAVVDGRGMCVFAGVAPGRYAVAVFHDENGNGRLDTNFLGIPREGVGASNNAKGRFGPPSFGDAAFSFHGGRLELKITIRYL